MATATDPPVTGGSQAALLRNVRLMWILIAVGVMMLVALTMVSFSGAYFTSHSSSPGNQFAAGEVGIALSVPGPVVNGDGMVPGDTRTGEQVVTNTGHRAVLVLDVLNLDTGSPLSQVLNVRVRQTNPDNPDAAYDGSLSGLDRVSLGTLAHDEARTYTITVEWPASEDDRNLEGEQTSLDFDWQLESVP